VPDSAVFPGGVHRLKNQQHRIEVGRTVTDIECLQNAKRLGKQVEIID
jgi:hypothetical protein